MNKEINFKSKIDEENLRYISMKGFTGEIQLTNEELYRAFRQYLEIHITNNPPQIQSGENQ